MKPCLPDWAPWDKEYPGSPCMIQPAETLGTWHFPEQCITCGAEARHNKEPWWNRRETWGRLRELEK